MANDIVGSRVSRLYSNFRGVDFSNNEVSLYRSPDSVNMWKDYKDIGKSIKTRPDIELLAPYSNTVYGLFFYKIGSVEHMIIHAGTSLYDYNMNTKETTTIKSTGMKPAKSMAFVAKNILFIKDGLNYLEYNGETVSEVVGDIPLTTASRAPDGGGSKAIEYVNILSDYRRNSFVADGSSTDFHLDVESFDSISEVKINDVATTDYTAYPTNGYISFTTAPAGATNGADNVVITYKKTISGDRNKINKCTILEQFDNRIFYSGNQDYPNAIFWCEVNNPRYIPDYCHVNDGMDLTPVKAMVAGNNALWSFKEESSRNTTVFYHNPSQEYDSAIEDYVKYYPASHSSISTGCVSTAINFNDDIVFFSNRGMEGLASTDVTTEQLLAHRSSLVDSKLLQETSYKNLLVDEYEGYLFVIVGNRVYLADSRNMFTNETHGEYEWFYWELPITPTCTKVYNGTLYIGTKDGIYTLGEPTETYTDIELTEGENGKYFLDAETIQETQEADEGLRASGDTIHLTDVDTSKEYALEFNGKSTQATRSGKNEIKNELTTRTVAGVIYTVNADKSVTINGTATANNTVYLWGNATTFPMILPAGTYKLSGGINNTAWVRLWNGVDQQYDDTGSGNEFTLTEETAFYVALRVLRGTTVDNLTFYPMLTISTVDQTYEEYGVMPSPEFPGEIATITGNQNIAVSDGTDTETYVLPLGNIELCKIGSAQDRIYKSNYKWYLEKNIGKGVLDGTESFIKINNVFQTSGVLPSGIGNITDGTSNYFKFNYYPSNITTLIQDGEFGWNSVKKLTFRNDSCSTVAEFKTWLSTHNTEVYYELATPTTTEITDTALITALESIEFYSGVTNIVANGGSAHYNYVREKPTATNPSAITNTYQGRYKTTINDTVYRIFIEDALKGGKTILDRLILDTVHGTAKVTQKIGTKSESSSVSSVVISDMKNNGDFMSNVGGTVSGKTITFSGTVANSEIQYELATPLEKEIRCISTPKSHWTTCDDSFKYPQYQKTTNKRGCTVDMTGDEVTVSVKADNNNFDEVETYENTKGYVVPRIKKKKWKEIQLKLSSAKPFGIYKITLESYLGGYTKR